MLRYTHAALKVLFDSQLDSVRTESWWTTAYAPVLSRFLYGEIRADYGLTVQFAMSDPSLPLHPFILQANISKHN